MDITQIGHPLYCFYKTWTDPVFLTGFVASLIYVLIWNHLGTYVLPKNINPWKDTNWLVLPSHLVCSLAGYYGYLYPQNAIYATIFFPLFAATPILDLILYAIPSRDFAVGIHHFIILTVVPPVWALRDHAEDCNVLIILVVVNMYMEFSSWLLVCRTLSKYYKAPQVFTFFSFLTHVFYPYGRFWILGQLIISYHNYDNTCQAIPKFGPYYIWCYAGGVFMLLWSLYYESKMIKVGKNFLFLKAKSKKN